MLLHRPPATILLALVTLTGGSFACGDDDRVEVECIQVTGETCPAPATARSSIDVECGETLQSVGSNGSREGDLCCYEVTIVRGECPSPF